MYCIDEKECPVTFPFDNGMLDPQNHMTTTGLVQDVTEQDRNALLGALGEVLAEIRFGKTDIFYIVYSHGFSSELINDIVQNSHKIFTVDDIVSSSLF